MKFEVTAKSFFANLVIQARYGLGLFIPLLFGYVIAVYTGATTMHPLVLVAGFILLSLRLIYIAYDSSMHSEEDYLELQDGRLIQCYRGNKTETDLTKVHEAQIVNFLGNKLFIITTDTNSFDINCSAYSSQFLEEMGLLLTGRLRAGGIADLMRYTFKSSPGT